VRERAEFAERARIDGELARCLLKRINASLPRHEQLRFIAVAHEPWSIANGRLTPTLKIKRSAIEAAVAGRIDAWYEAPGPVVWV